MDGDVELTEHARRFVVGQITGILDARVAQLLARALGPVIILADRDIAARTGEIDLERAGLLLAPLARQPQPGISSVRIDATKIQNAWGGTLWHQATMSHASSASEPNTA